MIDGKTKEEVPSPKHPRQRKPSKLGVMMSKLMKETSITMEDASDPAITNLQRRLYRTDSQEEAAFLNRCLIYPNIFQESLASPSMDRGSERSSSLASSVLRRLSVSPNSLGLDPRQVLERNRLASVQLQHLPHLRQKEVRSLV